MRKELIKLLSEKDLAEILQVSIVTLRRWRMFGRGPVFIRCGRAIRYETESVSQWLSERNSQKAA